MRADGGLHGKELLFAQKREQTLEAAGESFGAVGHFKKLRFSVSLNDVVVILGQILPVLIQAVAQRDLIPQKLAVFVVQWS